LAIFENLLLKYFILDMSQLKFSLKIRNNISIGGGAKVYVRPGVYELYVRLVFHHRMKVNFSKPLGVCHHQASKMEICQHSSRRNPMMIKLAKTQNLRMTPKNAGQCYAQRKH